MVPQPDSHDGNRREALRAPAGRALAIIADDLTGACDAAIAFAGQGETVRVELGDHRPASSGIWAFNTKSRELTPEEATAHIRQIARQLPSGHEIFKKIDSVFRGNTFAEIATAIEAFPSDMVVVAPAYPALGRRLLAGTLHVHEASGHHRLDVAEMLREHGCELQGLSSGSTPKRLAVEMNAALAGGRKAFLCDAEDQSDLVAVMEAARSFGKRVLWIGSGGLAQALAGEPEPAESDTELARGDIIFLIGSNHTTTKGQVIHLRRVSGLGETSCEHPARPAGGGLLLTILRGRTLEEDIRSALSLVRPEETGCLFMTGGDTALLACSALGIRSLRLLREFAPGIPLGVAEGGRFDGVPVVLKSGGFGKRDVLRHVLDAFGRKEPVHA